MNFQDCSPNASPSGRSLTSRFLHLRLRCFHGFASLCRGTAEILTVASTYISHCARAGCLNLAFSANSTCIPARIALDMLSGVDVRAVAIRVPTSQLVPARAPQTASATVGSIAPETHVSLRLVGEKTRLFGQCCGIRLWRGVQICASKGKLINLRQQALIC